MTLADQLKTLLDGYIDDAVAYRHHLHQIPELKFEEVQTCAFITEKLKSYGYDVQTGIAKTGSVALLDSGKPGRTIALRADIDALPITEATNISYQSKHPGVMHACGHDGHTATLLLVARILQKIKGQLTGKVKLLFQPAEEGGKGSTSMLQAGVLKDPDVDAIYGYHNWPGLPLGAVATRPGCILAGSGRFEIIVKGKRAHLARPQDAVNPILLGAQLVDKLRSLEIPGTVLNLLGFNSGDWAQGTPEQVAIVGCYFVEGEEPLRKLKADIASLTTPIGSVSFHEFQPATVNSPNETEQVFAAAKTIDCTSIIRLDRCQMAGEDFSEYLKQIPGCFFLVGAGETTAQVHTAEYDYPDAILRTAAHLMLQLVIQG